MRALLDTIDAEHPAFVVHLGNLKGRDESCSDTLLEARHDLLDSLIVDLLFVVVARAIGVAPGQFVALIALSQLVENLSHANLRLSLGWLGERLLVSPRFHRTHHAVGLGHERAGLFSNNKQLSDRLRSAGSQIGEKLWRMPLGPNYDKLIDSEIAAGWSPPMSNPAGACKSWRSGSNPSSSNSRAVRRFGPKRPR